MFLSYPQVLYVYSNQLINYTYKKIPPFQINRYMVPLYGTKTEKSYFHIGKNRISFVNIHK